MNTELAEHALQPIVDRRGHTTRYQLLRGQALATIDDLAQAARTIGVDRLRVGRPLCISINRAFLMSERVRALPPNLAVMDLPRGLGVNDAVAQRVIELRLAGFEFALEGVCSKADPRLRLLPHVTVLRIDVREASGPQAVGLATLGRALGCTPLADGVDEPRQWPDLRRAGFLLFRGLACGAPQALAPRPIPPIEHLLVERTLDLLRRGAPAEAVALGIASDPAMVLHLLLLAEACWVGGPTSVKSVSQLINGFDRPLLMAWLDLLRCEVGKHPAPQAPPHWRQEALACWTDRKLMAGRIEGATLAQMELAGLTGMVEHFQRTLPLNLHRVALSSTRHSVPWRAQGATHSTGFATNRPAVRRVAVHAFRSLAGAQAGGGAGRQERGKCRQAGGH